MDDIDIATVTKRSIHGVFALVSRTFFIGIFNLIINVLLTIYLTPTIFGVYFLVTAVIAFLQYFSDIGLAAALIQKKEQITQIELSTTFFIQQGLVIVAVALSIILAPFIQSLYHFNTEEMYLLYAIIISFFLSSLKTIPSVILERNIRFDKLVIPQIVETFVFGTTAFFFAAWGYGVTSFTLAVLSRGIFGLIAIYIICPWKPSLLFSRSTAKKLLSFGIPFQLNSFLALIKDDLFLAYVGKVLPIEQVGYIGFAQKWAYMPLRLVMDNIVRISFPSFSRLTHDTDKLARAIEKTLFATLMLIFPTLTGLVLLSPYFIAYIPKYQKWEPAIFSLAFFAINAAFSAISTPLTNALNAIGKVKTTLSFMIFWTIATWVVTPILIAMYGFNGVAIASAIIGASAIIIIAIVRKYIPFRTSAFLNVPVVATVIMGVAVYFLSKILIHNLFMIFVTIIIGGIVYVLALLALDKKQVISDAKTIIANLKK